ncbi:MAG: hypothetical protein HKO92_10425 [Flavobacteriaceae bacterium]|nr:hypothetical protein [Flavobacteriaceae bacterium]
MSNWTKEELVAYILLYAAHCNLEIDNHEKNVIISKVDMQTFQKVYDEFDKDNDYQSLQKIVSALEEEHYSKIELDILFEDIKKLFLSDGSYDTMERNLYSFLKNMLS